MNIRTDYRISGTSHLLRLFAVLPLLLLAAGCGAATPATPTVPPATPAPTETAPGAAPTPTGAAGQPTQPPGAPVTAKQYDHAPDYSWVAGQLKQEGSCWVVTYVSPLVDIAPDQYNNRFALLPGSGWDPAKAKDGQWVIVQGQPEPGTAPAPGCTAHGYRVSALQPNPNAPGAVSNTPGAAGAGVAFHVTLFTVSQNFEVRGQFNATNNGKTAVQEVAPLRVSVKRPSGDVVLDASAQGGVMDTKVMTGLPPGMTRPYGFSATPGKVYSQVAVGDEVAGALTVSVDGQEQQVALPTTKVTTVRIP
jgi:hypothetical protein